MKNVEISNLITPYGGELVNLVAAKEEIPDLKRYAGTLPSIQISERSVCDLELLAVGGFSPLKGFMGREDYDRCLEEMRISNGHLFSIPIVLPVEPSEAIHLDRDIALRNSKNELLAIMTIEEIYEWDKEATCRRVLGTTDATHPMVSEIQSMGPIHISRQIACSITSASL